MFIARVEWPGLKCREAETPGTLAQLDGPTAVSQRSRNNLTQPNLSPHWAGLNRAGKLYGCYLSEDQSRMKAEKKKKSIKAGKTERIPSAAWMHSEMRAALIVDVSKGLKCVGWLKSFHFCLLKHHNEQEETKNRHMFSRASQAEWICASRFHFLANTCKLDCSHSIDAERTLGWMQVFDWSLCMHI